MITSILSRVKGEGNPGINWKKDGVKVAQRKRKAEIREEMGNMQDVREERGQEREKKEQKKIWE